MGERKDGPPGELDDEHLSNVSGGAGFATGAAGAGGASLVAGGIGSGPDSKDGSGACGSVAQALRSSTPNSSRRAVTPYLI